MLTAATIDKESPEHLELTGTPFIPQERYQCGPAALATLLQHSGIEVTAEQLVPQIYLPERKGSLQVEMLAASRRYNRVPYVIDPNIAALVGALQSGYPVVVLQNLGLPAYPLWHYAVVIGYSSADDRIILRSGTDERKVLPAKSFIRSWRAAENWGLLLLPPGELPPDPDRQRYLGAVAAMEGISDPESILKACESAVERWPDDAGIQFAKANALYHLGRARDAETAYLGVLVIDPGHIAALNNLAGLYADQGCYDKAISTITSAMRIAGPASPLRATVLETRQDILKHQGAAGDAECRLRGNR